jgi:hypothetical protein
LNKKTWCKIAVSIRKQTFGKEFFIFVQKINDMDTITKKKTKKGRLLPNLGITKEELIASIKKAENGKFYTIEEFEMRFEEWKKEKGYC